MDKIFWWLYKMTTIWTAIQNNMSLPPDINFNERGLYGYTPLSYAIYNDSIISVQNLLDAGAPVNESESYFGIYPLSVAIRFNRLECLKLLISHGVDLNRCDYMDNTALILASSYGYLECIKLLIESGVDINAKNKWGWTSISRVAYLGSIDCLSYLLQYQPDLNIPNRNGETALYHAIHNGHIECSMLLLDHGAIIGSNNHSKHEYQKILDLYEEYISYQIKNAID